MPRRAPGQPPSPQGAGERAREVAWGDQSPADPLGEQELASIREAVAGRWTELSLCFGHLPTGLTLEVAPLQADGATSGYPSGARGPTGSELAESEEDCVLEALDDLVLPPPPRRIDVEVRA